MADSNSDSAKRNHQLEKSNKLAFATIVWNIIEAILAIWLAIGANSVSLMAYGIDGMIETASASVMMWRVTGSVPLSGYHPASYICDLKDDASTSEASSNHLRMRVCGRWQLPMYH